MLKIESAKELQVRLGLQDEPEHLGYVLFQEGKGYLQKFQFKFNTVDPDKNMLGMTHLKNLTTSTKQETYLYDLETAELVQHILRWHYGRQHQIHYVLKHQVRGVDKIRSEPVIVLAS